MRYREGIVARGVEVAVLGRARWERDPEGAGGDYRAQPRRLVLEAPEGGELVVSTEPALTGE
jgi:hypothetical protein